MSSFLLLQQCPACLVRLLMKEAKFAIQTKEFFFFTLEIVIPQDEVTIEPKTALCNKTTKF